VYFILGFVFFASWMKRILIFVLEIHVGSENGSEFITSSSIGLLPRDGTGESD
jgi:hypothetical protein